MVRRLLVVRQPAERENDMNSAQLKNWHYSGWNLLVKTFTAAFEMDSVYIKSEKAPQKLNLLSKTDLSISAYRKPVLKKL